jgi:Fibronectin type III domain
MVVQLCSSCKNESATGPAPSPLNVGGTWSGAGGDPTSPAALAFVLNQTASSVEGTFTATFNATGASISGTVTGSVSASTFTGELHYQYNNCNERLGLTAQVSTSSMSGNYSERSSCAGPISGGQFSLNKQGDVPTVGPNGGVVIAAGGNVVLAFPPGAVTQNTAITAEAATTYPPYIGLAGGTVYTFGPSGTQFANPVWVTIKYDPSRLATDVQETSLRLHKVAGDRWVEVEGSFVNSTDRSVTGSISSFSSYGIVSTGCPIAALQFWPLCTETREVGQDYAQFNWGSVNRYHAGIDILASVGTVVSVALDAGEVIKIQENDVGCSPNVSGACKDHGYGNSVIVRHFQGAVYSQYSHLSSIDDGLKAACGPLDQNTKRRICITPVPVTRKMYIGQVGCSRYGLSDCTADFVSHLHFETKNFSTLGSNGDDDGNFGYTGDGITRSLANQPDRFGYYDPVVWITSQVAPINLTPQLDVPVRVTPSGQGVSLRIGPGLYRVLRAVSNGESFTAQRFAGPTTSPECSAGWYQLVPSDGSEFPDPSRSASTIPDVWVCRGNSGEDWVAPLSEAIPPAPSNLVATAASATEIDLNWTNTATNFAGLSFVIERAPGGTTNFTEIGVLYGATTWHDIGLTPSTTYSYRVLATAFPGVVSPYSNTATASTLSGGALPPEPSGLTATASSTTQIDLAWQDNSSNEDGFQIEQAPGSTASFTLIATVGPNVTSYSSTGLTANTGYSYRVRAYNAAGPSAYSNVATATTSGGTTLPLPPSALTATTNSATQIDLVWQDNSGNEDGFQIEQAPGGTTSFTQIATVGPNVTSYSSTGLTANTSYSYRVRAYNAAGPSAYSNTATATTETLVSLVPPSGLAATAVSTSEIDLVWQDNSGNEDGFQIEQAPGRTTSFTQIATVGPNVTSYSSTGLTPNTSYSYRVRAYNAAGSSAYSNIATATTSSGVSSDLSGSWSYIASPTQGPGMNCEFALLSLQLTQTGSQLSGTHDQLGVTCVLTATGDVVEAQAPAGAILNGTVGNFSVTGTPVAFDFTSSDWHNTGVALQNVSGGFVMTGSFTARVDFGGVTGVVTLTGHWDAAQF